MLITTIDDNNNNNNNTSGCAAKETMATTAAATLAVSEGRAEASRWLSMRRAAIVASASTGSKIRCCGFDATERYARLGRDKISLDAFVLDCELRFLDCLAGMDHRDRTSTVFELLDADSGGQIDVHELAKGLRKMAKSTPLSLIHI